MDKRSILLLNLSSADGLSVLMQAMFTIGKLTWLKCRGWVKINVCGGEYFYPNQLLHHIWQLLKHAIGYIVL